MGKGANETISYLHHYLTSDHSVNCKNLQFHCDNCCGQNKKNAVIQYMCYRLFQGFNSNIEVSSCYLIIPGLVQIGALV